MRKTFLLFAIMATMTCWSQYRSQLSAKNAFEYANKTIDIGILGGVIGVQDNYSYGAMGLNMTIYGVYADFMGWPKAHSNDVRVEKWHDKYSVACHFGYQIPLSKSFRIIPVIGYAKVEEGTTDGWDWKVGSNGIINKFHAENRVDGFDYGGVLVINSGKWNIYASATRRIIFGGIGLSLGTR